MSGQRMGEDALASGDGGGEARGALETGPHVGMEGR
jgi:hypothetical protein